MTELGVGYLSIVASTNGMQRQITQAMTGAAGKADKVGESMGSKLVAGMSKTLKVGAVAVGATVAGVLATSITKGLDRLSAIDNAQGKLTALGNSTASTAKIMDSALASVKGTAYGLGDAATIAASAVAAGVKPGQDLTRYLKLTADAASIAGVNLSEMGQIINKVQTSGTAYTMEITQLADRGLPIWQWLSKEMGVAQSEMKDLVAEGKVDSATYLAAIENNIGGAATAATTVSSAWANLGAAQGRFGATVAGPIFRQAIPAFSALTKSVDELDARAKPVMADFEENLTSKYIPAMLDFGRAGKSGFDEFRNSDLVVGSVSRLGSVFGQLSSTARDLAPSVGSIVRSLSEASAAVGVSTWEIFLSTLQASATILDATLVPALDLTAGLLEDNQGAVIALAGAWLAFRTIPSVMGRIATSVGGVRSQVQSADRATAGYRASVTAMTSDFRRLAPQIGVVGGAMRALGNNSSTIRTMQTQFIGASSAATGFRAALRTGVTPALGAMRAGVSSAAGALGGPWGIAIAAATIGVLNYSSGVAKASSQQRILNDAIQAGATANQDLFTAIAGGDEAEITSQITANVRALRQEQQSLAETAPSYMQKTMAGWDGLGRAIGWTRGETLEATLAQDEQAEQSEAIASTLNRLKVSNEDVGRAVSGSAAEYNKLSRQMIATGDDGAVAADWLRDQRVNYEDLSGAMDRIGPVGVSVSAGLREIAGAGGDANKKLSGLQTVLRGLGILETDEQAALFEAAEAVRDIAEAAAAGVDPVGGLGDALLKLDGTQLDETQANAKELRSSLQDLGSEFYNLTNAGMTGTEAYGKVEAGLQSLSDMYDLPIEKVAELARQFGIVPDVVDTSLVVDGGPEALTALTELKLRLDELKPGEPRVITMIVQDEGARQALRDAGHSVQVLNETTGEIRVTARTEAFNLGVAAVQAQLRDLGAKETSPKINADATWFNLRDEQTRSALAELDRTSVAPQIGALIDKFLEGRSVTMSELNKIDLSTAEPDVKLLIEQALAQAQIINDAIDKASRDRRTAIEFDLIEYGARVTSFRNSQPGGNVAGPVSILPTNATGSRLPTTGPGTDRTDGILGVSRLTGAPTTWVDAGEWIINGRSSEIYDKELAQINAGTFPRHEEGGRLGVVSASDLLSFVNGSQSQPLTGAMYDWGGVRWGDCSGAMSAIARFAVGLAPFADRFATASQGSALSAMGFSMGRGGPGDLRFGWVNGGPGGGHTAGTLPDDTNVEMGGGYGGGMVGGTVGSDSSQFTDHAYLTIPGTSSFTNPGGYPSGGRGRTSRSAPVWTDKQQLQLEDAAIDVTRAEEARAKVEAEVGEGKKTQADLDKANSKVALAEQKVVDLQAKKDEVASYVADGPAPQAPALSRAFTDAESERIDAQVALEAANTRRNEVYDDPDSTDAERDKADADLYAAEQKLKLAGTTDKSKSASDTPSSWSELAGTFAKDFIAGQVSDALDVFGIPDELPSAVRAAQMLAEALSDGQAGQQMTGPAGVNDPGGATQQEILADSPIAYDPSKGPEQWVPVVDEALARTGRALSETAGTVERIAQQSGGDPANLLGLSLREFSALRDPSLPNDPGVPLSNLVAGLRATKGVRAYHDGGTVTGPAGRDQVPALLERKEFVVQSRYADTGSNPAILTAMNSGAQFAVGQQEPSVVKQGATFNFYASSTDEQIRKWKVAEMVAAASQFGTLA